MSVYMYRLCNVQTAEGVGGGQDQGGAQSCDLERLPFKSVFAGFVAVELKCILLCALQIHFYTLLYVGHLRHSVQTGARAEAVESTCLAHLMLV